MTAQALFKDATGAQFPFPVPNPDPATNASLLAIKTALDGIGLGIQGLSTSQAAQLTAQQALAAALATLETHADDVADNAVLTAIKAAVQAAATHTDAAAQIAAVQALAATAATHADVAAEGSTEASILAALTGALTVTLPNGSATAAKQDAIKASIDALTAVVSGEATTEASVLQATQALTAAVALLETHADDVADNAVLTQIKLAVQAASTHTDSTATIAAVNALASTVATHADVAAEGSTEAAILADLNGVLTFNLPTGAATAAKQDALQTTALALLAAMQLLAGDRPRDDNGSLRTVAYDNVGQVVDLDAKRAVTVGAKSDDGDGVRTLPALTALAQAFPTLRGGVVVAGEVYNPGGATAWVQFFDAAAAANVTLGTTAPLFQLPVAAGASKAIPVGVAGLLLALGLFAAATTAPFTGAGTGNTVATTAVALTLTYKQ